MKIPMTVYETVDPGLYQGYIESIEEDEGQYGPQLKYTIVLEEEGVRLTTWSSQSFSAKSKLYRWAQACFGGAAIPKDFVLDTDSLINRPIMVSVTIKETDSGDFNRIQDLLPIPKKGKAKGNGGNGQRQAQPQAKPKAAPPPEPKDPYEDLEPWEEGVPEDEGLPF